MFSNSAKALPYLLALLIALAAAGCLRTDEDEQRMPWNTPQPWENNPGLPGMPQQ